MTRRLFAILAALSLLLCLLVVVIWTRKATMWQFSSERAPWGNVDVVFTSSGMTLRSTGCTTEDAIDGDVWFRFPGGFYHHRVKHHTDYVADWYFLNVQYWLTVLLTAVAPAAWSVHQWRRPRLMAFGCCTTCGYDLRATPERCPECGTAAALSAGSVFTKGR